MSSNTQLLAQPPYPWFYDYWQQFSAQTIAARLPHALLLKGLDGIGSDALAFAMAQYLLCRAPLQNVSCGRCRGCELLSAGSHPDYVILAPEEGSSVLKIAQVRELAQFVGNTAQQGGRKVIVVSPAEAMNIEAANALLKNLEEPAGDTFFILVTYQVARVLPTIRSRTSQIALPMPSYAQSLAWLGRSQVTNAEQLLHATSGVPVKAMAWFEGNHFEVYGNIASALEAVLSGDVSAIEGAKKLAAFDVLQVFIFTQQWLQEAIKLLNVVPTTQPPVVRAFAKLPVQSLFSLLDIVQQRLANFYAGSNPNKVLACEELLLMILALQADFNRRQL